MTSRADQLRRGFEMGPEVVIEALRESGEELDPEIDAALGMQVARLAPRLFALIREQLAGPGGAEWGAIHAVHLFGEDRFVPSVEVILEAVLATSPEEPIHDAALIALGKIGPPAAPAILAALATADEDVRAGLLGALADTRHPDPRVLPLLVADMARDPVGGAGNLVEYGDPRALPSLSSALDAIEPSDAEGSRRLDQNVIELAAAIEDLGGVLTPEQERKLVRVRDARRRIADMLVRARDAIAGPVPPVFAAPKPGRNAPCWCGSGRKYKKCHLAEDERGD